MLEIDTCDNCGTQLEGEAHFAIGKTWCASCWSGRQPPKGIMPPSPAYQRQLRPWCAPTTSVQR